MERTEGFDVHFFSAVSQFTKGSGGLSVIVKNCAILYNENISSHLLLSGEILYFTTE